MFTIFGRICNAIAQLFAAGEAAIEPANSIDALAFQLLTAVLRWDQTTLEAWVEILGNADWAALAAQEYCVLAPEHGDPVVFTGVVDQPFNPLV